MSAHPESRSAPASRPGVDVPTLLITAVASAAAAYACSKVWAPGTLPSAAAMPVLVALIKEALARPAEAVTRAVPVRGVVRSAAGPSSAEPPPPGPPPTERVAQQGEITYHAGGWSARRWRLAIVTGLLGFVIAALVLTVPEIVAGRSASGGGRSTTLFGGDREKRSQKHDTKTTTVPGRTVTVRERTVVVPAPTETVTVPPQRTETVPSVTTTTTTPTTTQPPGRAPSPSARLTP